MKIKIYKPSRLRNIGLIIVDWLRRMPAVCYLLCSTRYKKAGISIILIFTFLWQEVAKAYPERTEGHPWDVRGVALRPRAMEERKGATTRPTTSAAAPEGMSLSRSKNLQEARRSVCLTILRNIARNGLRSARDLRKTHSLFIGSQDDYYNPAICGVSINPKIIECSRFQSSSIFDLVVRGINKNRVVNLYDGKEYEYFNPEEIAATLVRLSLYGQAREYGTLGRSMMEVAAERPGDVSRKFYTPLKELAERMRNSVIFLTFLSKIRPLKMGNMLETRVESPLPLDSIVYVLVPKALYPIAKTAFAGKAIKIVKVDYRDDRRVSVCHAPRRRNDSDIRYEPFKRLPDFESAILTILNENNCIAPPSQQLSVRGDDGPPLRRLPTGEEMWASVVKLPTLKETPTLLRTRGVSMPETYGVAGLSDKVFQTSDEKRGGITTAVAAPLTSTPPQKPKPASEEALTSI